MSISFRIRFAFSGLAIFALAGCLGGGAEIAPSTKQLPAEAQVLLATKGMKQEAPIFVRIFKEESELEIWKQLDDGRYAHFKTYPICAWSGKLGPKIAQGDKQAPEGFYTVRPGQMNPNSQFHLAFNLGYPNDYDRVHGRDGSALMVHGKCKSAGCFAMTDALIEEIYILARESFKGGQTSFHVNAFPFRMTEENMKRHASSEWIEFWRQLKIGYDSFDFYRVPPKVAVCAKQYLVNVNFLGQDARPDPQGSCPAFEHVAPDLPSGFENLPGQQIARSQRPAQPQMAAASSFQRPAMLPQESRQAPAPTSRTASVSPALHPDEADPNQPVRIGPANAGSQASAPAPAPAEEMTIAVQSAPAAQAPPPAGEQQTRRSGKGDRLPPPPAAPAAGFGYAPAAGSN